MYEKWARDAFTRLFVNPALNVNNYLSQPAFLTQLFKQQSMAQKETLEGIRDFLVTQRPPSFAECLTWARLQFEQMFNNEIQQLLFNFPRDSVNKLLKGVE